MSHVIHFPHFFLLNLLIVDTVPPDVFGCPEDIAMVIELGSEDPLIFWAEPFATDLGEVSVMQNHEPGNPFPVGTSVVNYVFSDDATPPNTAQCTFSVTVLTGMAHC